MQSAELSGLAVRLNSGGGAQEAEWNGGIELTHGLIYKISLIYTHKL